MSTTKLRKELEVIVSLRKEDFKSKTMERAKWMIADTIFAAWFGTRNDEVKKYIELVTVSEKSDVHPILIVGTDRYATIQDSSVIHGTAIVANELDEGNQYAKGHPAAHIFPPAYAAAITDNISGEDFVYAFMIGYEIAAKFAYASNMKDDMHPHGTWGTIGGAVAVGVIQGKSKEDLIEIALLAGTFPLATSWEAAVTGTSARNLYTGIGSMIAYQSVVFQQAGFASSTHVVEHIWGKIVSEQMDLSKLEFSGIDQLLLDQSFFKLYPSCRFSHAAIDALYEITNQHQVDPNQIKSVVVETYNLAARLDNPKPENALASKFSIPYVLAVIISGKSLYKSTEKEMLTNDSLLKLAETISIKENKEMTLKLPNYRPAKVSITYKNGDVLTGAVENASGGYERPFPIQELKEKYQAMMGDILSKIQVEEVLGQTIQVDHYTYFNNLLEFLKIKEAQHVHTTD